ncbi:MAG: hypothetical protein U0946_06980 [Patescibacteria group bacterium]|nr:hypothetical protein [Patescibacteria group bacterium]
MKKAQFCENFEKYYRFVENPWGESYPNKLKMKILQILTTLPIEFFFDNSGEGTDLSYQEVIEGNLGVLGHTTEMGGSEKIILTSRGSVGDEEWTDESVAIHEFMHVWEIKNTDHLGGNAAFQETVGCQESSTSPGNFTWTEEAPPTAYAYSNCAEDFAESGKLYVTDSCRLIEKTPKRYAFLKENVFHGKEYLPIGGCEKKTSFNFRLIVKKAFAQELKNYNDFLWISPGKTKINDVLKRNGKPKNVIRNKNRVIYEYSSGSYSYPHVIIAEDDKVIFLNYILWKTKIY